MDTISMETGRRRFIQTVGLGAAAFATFPVQSAVASHTGGTNFHFMALSAAAEVDGVHHSIIMAGQGTATGSSVVGGGGFQHQDGDPDKPIPKPILGEGTWVAKRVVGLDVIGTFGIGVAGVLDMDVVLYPTGGGRIPASLQVVCNIPPAGLFTGLAEGYTLSVPGAPWGAFEALDPPMGVTWLNTAHIAR